MPASPAATLALLVGAALAAGMLAASSGGALDLLSQQVQITTLWWSGPAFGAAPRGPALATVAVSHSQAAGGGREAWVGAKEGAAHLLSAACGPPETRPPCLAGFQATCTHLYTSALLGFATPALAPSDVAALRACGLGGLRVEADAPITRHYHPGRAARRRRRLRPHHHRRRLAGKEEEGAPSGLMWGESAADSRVGEEPFDTLAAEVGALEVPPGSDAPGAPPPPPLPAALWSLDMLDAAPPARDGAFTPLLANRGAGVTIYHLDTGVAAGHREFGGRAALAADLTGGGGGSGGDDDDGHGTHTASSAVGAMVGVAPGATLRAYRVLDGAGNGRVSALVAALDGIVASRRAVPANASIPALALMSLGTPANGRNRADAAAVRKAVASLVGSGVAVIAAAGNGGPADDACDTLPAALSADGPASGVLAVAASDLADKFEVGRGGRRISPPYPFSSTGRCVSVWAPGVDVLGACGAAGRCADPASNRAYTFASGSSMAAPHVAGAAALFLSANPQASPAEVVEWVVGAARRGAVVGKEGRGGEGSGGDGVTFLPGTTDRLLYLGRE